MTEVIFYQKEAEPYDFLNTMKNLKKICDKVKWILERFEGTRGDDRILILKYLQYFEKAIYYDSTTQTINLVKPLTYPEFRRLTSFESITRARRKIQEKYPSLRPTLKTEIKRDLREQVIRTNIGGLNV